MAGKKKAKAPAREPDISVKVDASLKRRYDALAAQIHAAQTKGASAFDSLWEAVGEIIEHEPPLFVVAGYATADEFFKERLGESRRNAFRYVRVAKFASPREEEKYGTTRLDAALSFLEAKLGAPLAHPPLPIAFDRLKIPVTRDGKTTSVPLEKAAVEEIVAATRALDKSGKKKPTSSLERALGEALRKHQTLASSAVRVRAGLVSFTSVPAAALSLFGKTVGAVDVPAAEEKPAAKRPKPTK